MKILTLYYSRSGHTKQVAELIQSAVGGDIAPLRAKKTYSSSYALAVAQVGMEKLGEARPGLRPLPVEPKDYDVLFLGTPVWWFTIATPMKTFLETYDLSGVFVCPFLTSGGGPRDSLRDLERLCTGDMGDGYHVRFAGSRMMADEGDIRRWAKACVMEREGRR